jgi:branched-chain amino acid transport system permease protein
MADFIQLLVSGLTTGGIYALAAVGFTLLWQTSQTINFAQGEFVMLPAFFVLIAMGFFGMPFWLAVVVALVVSMITLGVMFKKLMVDPMITHGVLPLVIASIGLAIFMKEAVREFYGADAWPFPPLAAAINVNVFGAALAVQSLVVLGVTIAAVVALQLFLNMTRVGRCMQATAQNPNVARLLGIPVERMILYTFLINAALVMLQRRIARSLRLHRRHHRRLQSGARRHCRRIAPRCDR